MQLLIGVCGCGFMGDRHMSYAKACRLFITCMDGLCGASQGEVCRCITHHARCLRALPWISFGISVLVAACFVWGIRSGITSVLVESEMI